MEYLNLTTEELFTLASTGNEQALWTLCKSYEPLFKSEARLYRGQMADAYDVADFVSIGYILVWDIVRKGNYKPGPDTQFGGYLKQAVRWRFCKEFTDFAKKNLICTGESENCRGERSRGYAISEKAVRERELAKARQERYKRRQAERIDAERAAQGLPPVYRAKYATEEEKAAHEAERKAHRAARMKQYRMEHKEEIKAKKAAYFQKNKRRYRLNDAIRNAKKSIETWTARGNEARAQEARERLARYEAEKAELVAKAS